MRLVVLVAALVLIVGLTSSKVLEKREVKSNYTHSFGSFYEVNLQVFYTKSFKIIILINKILDQWSWWN